MHTAGMDIPDFVALICGLDRSLPGATINKGTRMNFADSDVNLVIGFQDKEFTAEGETLDAAMRKLLAQALLDGDAKLPSADDDPMTKMTRVFEDHGYFIGSVHYIPDVSLTVTFDDEKILSVPASSSFGATVDALLAQARFDGWFE